MLTWNLETIWRLVREHGPLPYSFHVGARRHEYDIFAKERLAASLSNPWAIPVESVFEGACGFALMLPLAWDTEMFGMSAVRLDYPSAEPGGGVALAEASVLAIERAGFEHATIRIDAHRFETLNAFLRAGFEIIDGIQTFAITLTEEPLLPPPGVRLHESADIETIASIARRAYTFDRFHNERAIGKDQADLINEMWLRNSCAGTAADAVWVFAPNESVESYVTCKLDRGCASAFGTSVGTIVMVASAIRRSGGAKAATRGALRWFWENEARIVEVGTQLTNVPAARLYESCGFRTVSVSLTLRLLRK